MVLLEDVNTQKTLSKGPEKKQHVYNQATEFCFITGSKVKKIGFRPLMG